MKEKNLTIQGIIKEIIKKQLKKEKSSSSSSSIITITTTSNSSLTTSFSSSTSFDLNYYQIEIIKLEFLLKENSTLINEIIYYILNEIKTENGKIRIILIEITNYFFHKSLQFRKEFCDHHLRQFIGSYGLTNFGGIVPKTNQRETQSLLLRSIAIWNYEYGKLFPQLRAMFRYLNESLKLPVPDISVRL